MERNTEDCQQSMAKTVWEMFISILHVHNNLNFWT